MRRLWLNPMLCYRRFVCMSKPFVSVVLVYSGLSLLLVRGVDIRPKRDDITDHLDNITTDNPSPAGMRYCISPPIPSSHISACTVICINAVHV